MINNSKESIYLFVYRVIPWQLAGFTDLIVTESQAGVATFDPSYEASTPSYIPKI